jgi:TetR/AcrR family transcriptional regulator, repressor for uid operon
MNVHSLFQPMSQTQIEPTVDRRRQILDAAMVCFAKRGFHQASMHDISAEAGISVGLIYRYFENKEAVISAMADQHKTQIQEVLERARQAPNLLESLEILFTAHCCSENTPEVTSAFVVDLFAEASRNNRVADLVRDVSKTTMDGVADLIARSPESKSATHNLTPRQITELIFAVNDGILMREVLDVSNGTENDRRERHLKVARSLWRLLFSTETATVYA